MLLLDEPLAGLAAAERERVSNLVRTIAANIPVLIVEHDIDRVLGFSHIVTVMNQGEVLMTGTPDAVRADVRVQEIYTGKGVPEVEHERAEDAGQSTAPLLRLARVNTFYGKSHILNDATLDVREGEIVALLGRNGAGKSTLLRHAAGLMEPTRGRVQRAGRVALLLQNPGDYLIHERVAEEAPAEALAAVGLAGMAERNPKDLSGGERPGAVPASTLEGVVKWFEPDKGYGFIAPDGGGKDIFIHVTALRRSGLAAIDSGQRVRVDAVGGKKGLEAERIILI